MKNPRKNEPALSDRLLKLRFAEKKHGLSTNCSGDVLIVDREAPDAASLASARD